ncbi:MAG: C25 family cysteine peptidase, partial [Thermoanaerobaculia bacterium]|nr:C25 family cysteine peptidase [Thermoanaerobaculia bacterium]
HRPDLAVGWFTVVSSEEVEAIVDKTIDYMRSPRDEPWQRNILWITNESPLFQQRSDTLAEEMQSRGFRSTKIYPSSEEADNAEHQASLLAALEKGQAVVHFLGHGGRYIWRTGPPDFRKNHDLFTLDHLDRLAPTHKLPVVLSMTCYSAPFDHPTADSIGEKFLRLPDRGAVAVLAASWRNSPTQELSREILLALVGSQTLGEAVLEAKRATERRDLIETYNLLGDPALVLPVHPDGSETEAARRQPDEASP